MLSAVATLPSSSKWIFTSSNAWYWNDLKSILVYTAVYLVELFLLSQRFSWSFKAKDKLYSVPQKICQNTYALFAKNWPKASWATFNSVPTARWYKEKATGDG